MKYLKEIFNAKVIYTILPICVTGIGIMAYNTKYEYGLSEILFMIKMCICGVASTVAIVPLMYSLIPPLSFPLADDSTGIQYMHEPRGIKKMVYGVMRGTLSAFLIMYSTAMLPFVDTEYGIIEHIIALIFATPYFILLGSLKFYEFIICAIASFLIADYCVKGSVKAS